MGFDIIDGVLDRGYVLRILIRDLSLKLLFKSHDQFNGVERVGSKVFHEGSRVLDILLFHTKLLRDYLLDAFFDAAHFRIVLLLRVDYVVATGFTNSRAVLQREQGFYPESPQHLIY